MHGCRTCLSRHDLSPLFSEQGVVRFSSDQLLSVTGVKIELNDGLPQSACATCIKQISRTLELREMSSKVDRMLRSMMLKYGTVMKTEQNHNPLPNLIDPFSNEDILFCKDIKQESTKAFCPSDHDHNYHNNSSLIEHTEINTSPQSYKNDRNKISINDFEISDRNDSDVNDSNDNFNSSDATPTVAMIVESIDVNGEYNGENTILSNDNDSFKQSNDVFEPSRLPTTQSKMMKANLTKILPKILSNATDNKKKENITRYFSMKSLTQQESAEALADSDLARWKLLDIQIKKFMFKKKLDKLFGDNVTVKLINAHNTNKSSIENVKLPVENLTVNEKTNEKNRSGEIKTIARNDKDKHMSLLVKPCPPKGPFRCKLCNKKLATLASFRNHTKLHFEPEFPCQQCDKKFYGRSVLVYHQQRMHGKEKPLSCSVCGYKAVHEYILKEHQLKHTGERPFVCNECGASFRSRVVIVTHMQRHFGVKNIQCEMCSRMFTNRSKLGGHQMKTHLMTYTYHCYMCPRTYKSADSTKKHLLKFHGVPRKEQRVIKFVKTKRTDNVHIASAKSPIPTTKCRPTS